MGLLKVDFIVELIQFSIFFHVLNMLNGETQGNFKENQNLEMRSNCDNY